jgi:Sugar (and other) transporter
VHEIDHILCCDDIPDEIGLTPTVSRILAACNGTEYFLALVDRGIYRRKGRTTQADALWSCRLFCFHGRSRRYDQIGDTAPGVVAAAFLFILNSFFAVGCLGIAWLYPTDTVLLRIQTPANALSTSANWGFIFMVVMITPVSLSSIGYKTYIIFAFINAFICPVVYFFYPETAYRSPEEMDVIFRKTKNIFMVVSTVKDEPHMYGKSGEGKWPRPHHS